MGNLQCSCFAGFPCCGQHSRPSGLEAPPGQGLCLCVHPCSLRTVCGTSSGPVLGGACLPRTGSPEGPGLRQCCGQRHGQLYGTYVLVCRWTIDKQSNKWTGLLQGLCAAPSTAVVCISAQPGRTEGAGLESCLGPCFLGSPEASQCLMNREQFRLKSYWLCCLSEDSWQRFQPKEAPVPWAAPATTINPGVIADKPECQSPSSQRGSRGVFNNRRQVLINDLITALHCIISRGLFGILGGSWGAFVSWHARDWVFRTAAR